MAKAKTSSDEFGKLLVKIRHLHARRRQHLGKLLLSLKQLFPGEDIDLIGPERRQPVFLRATQPGARNPVVGGWRGTFTRPVDNRVYAVEVFAGKGRGYTHLHSSRDSITWSNSSSIPVQTTETSLPAEPLKAKEICSGYWILMIFMRKVQNFWRDR